MAGKKYLARITTRPYSTTVSDYWVVSITLGILIVSFRLDKSMLISLLQSLLTRDESPQTYLPASIQCPLLPPNNQGYVQLTEELLGMEETG